MKGLIAMAKEGKAPRLQIASWNRKAKDTGQEYQYVTAEVFWDAEAQAAPPPPPPPAPIELEIDDIPF